MPKFEVSQYECKSCMLLSDVNFVRDVFLWSPGSKLISSYTQHVRGIPILPFRFLTMITWKSIRLFNNNYWWPAGYRGTPKIFWYTGKILPVASVYSQHSRSAFLVSIRVSICYVIKQTSRRIPVCLLKRAR